MLRRLAFALCLLLAMPALAQDAVDQDLVETATDMFTMNEKARAAAIEKLAARNRPDIAAPLIELMPLMPQNAERIGEILRQVTGADIKAEWFEWMLWQEANPQVRPFAGYDAVKARFLAQIDLEFLRFVFPGVKSDIRLEEIAWGGLKFDAVQALTNPKYVAAGEAAWLADDDAVLGVVINGEARAYPRRILDRHEIVNDTIGGVPVTLSLCVLCNAAVLYESRPEGRVLPFEFGVSGLVYRSNKLMFDRQSDSLWSQITGRPVVGDLAGSGVQLKTRPVVSESWAAWRAAHPETKVLSLETGHGFDYAPNPAYAAYLASPAMAFPAAMTDWSLQPKRRVFGLRLDGVARSWPLALFAKTPIVNDSIGATPVVLIGNAKSDTVRAYRRGRQEFKRGATALELVADGRAWKITEDALLGPANEKLDRLPGTATFWFAWQGNFPAAK